MAGPKQKFKPKVKRNDSGNFTVQIGKRSIPIGKKLNEAKLHGILKLQFGVEAKADRTAIIRDIKAQMKQLTSGKPKRKLHRFPGAAKKPAGGPVKGKVPTRKPKRKRKGLKKLEYSPAEQQAIIAQLEKGKLLDVLDFWKTGKPHPYFLKSYGWQVSKFQVVYNWMIRANMLKGKELAVDGIMRTNTRKAVWHVQRFLRKWAKANPEGIIAVNASLSKPYYSKRLLKYFKSEKGKRRFSVDGTLGQQSARAMAAAIAQHLKEKEAPPRVAAPKIELLDERTVVEEPPAGKPKIRLLDEGSFVEEGAATVVRRAPPAEVRARRRPTVVLASDSRPASFLDGATPVKEERKPPEPKPKAKAYTPALVAKVKALKPKDIKVVLKKGVYEVTVPSLKLQFRFKPKDAKKPFEANARSRTFKLESMLGNLNKAIGRNKPLKALFDENSRLNSEFLLKVRRAVELAVPKEERKPPTRKPDSTDTFIEDTI